MIFGIKYRTRNVLLLAGGLVLGILCYYFAIEKTISSALHIREMEQIIARNGNISSQIADLNTELSSLENSLGVSESSRDEIQRKFLDRVSWLADSLHVKVEKIEPVHLADQNGVTIATQRLTLDGKFSSQLQLLNHLESHREELRLVACNFHKEMEYSSRTRKLYLTLYAQTVLP